MKSKFTAVIPTLNRPQDLIRAIESICSQTCHPDELIIVDQSLGSESRDLVGPLMLKFSFINLIYIHDSSILGLVDAKRVAVSVSRGEIVCFLEDDVVLEDDFIEQIKRGFTSRPEMLGCCGVITNPPSHSLGYKFLFNIFHRGIFKDIRVNIYGVYSGRSNDLIASNMLSGGLSAWRREVFSVIKFDVVNEFHMYEDIEFSTRAGYHFGSRFFINPNACLKHNPSPINRAVLGAKHKRKLIECILYYKKRRYFNWAISALLWLLIGFLIEALLQSFRATNIEPVKGYFSGIKEGVLRKCINSNHD